MIANTLQSKIIETPLNEINIYANGRGVGTSVGVCMKVIQSGIKDIVFICRGVIDKHQQFETLIRTLKEVSGNFEYNRANMNIMFTTKFLFSRDITTIINFLTVDEYERRLGIVKTPDLVIVENIHWYKGSFALISEHSKKKIFTTQPYYCGFRNPVYDNGILEREDLSWDYSLINWKEGMTKASPKDYKDNVTIINLPFADNPYFSYYEIEYINPSDKHILGGEWRINKNDHK